MNPEQPAGPSAKERAAEKLRVRIAVLTYKRPEDIGEALPRLLAQARSVATDDLRVDIVVVDNDSAGSAEKLVTEFSEQHRDIPVRYENEVEPGISAARNRALATATDCDVLIFIDDDERPTERWLERLLDTYRTFHSAAVVGPVISEFAVEPSAWVKAGRFFDRRRLPTGTEITVAATNNLLLDLRTVRDYGLEFDPQFGISGGGDTLFTRDLYRRGGRMIWCDEAIVIDVVPAARTTRDWVTRRALRIGTSESATSIKLAPTPPVRALVRLKLTGRGAARIAGGAARVAVGTVTKSQRHQARGLRTLCRGVGILSGAWGYQYQEYKRG